MISFDDIKTRLKETTQDLKDRASGTGKHMDWKRPNQDNSHENAQPQWWQNKVKREMERSKNKSAYEQER